MPTDLALLGLLLAGYALVAARLDKLSIGPAIAFLVIGLVLSQEALGFVSFEPTTELVKLLAEAALALLLFADASQVPGKALRHDLQPILRLLLIGLPLTIVVGSVGAWRVVPGVSLGLALLIGSSLAPTDAALGQPVVTNPAVPPRVRRLLNVESGLNDGIATPFVFLALALAASEGTGQGGWLASALTDFAIGLAVGGVLGLAGGFLLDVALARGWASPASSRLFVLALAAACYLVAISLDGNGFIAAFVGGLAYGIGSRNREERAVRFTETQGSLLEIGVWTSFGLILAGEVRTDLWNANAMLYAILSLTAFRMVPVAAALLGSRFRLRTVLFMGWFGPRGLASIVFLIIGLDGLHEAGVDVGPFAAAVTWTVLLSVLAHGISAGPLAKRYGAWANSLSDRDEELADTQEPAPPRLAWAHEER